MTAPRPTNTLADPPRGCGPAWERPGAQPATTAPCPTNTLADPPRGSRAAWERPGSGPSLAPPTEASAARASTQLSIDRFVDALWIEDGLAAHTLAAYRRDLALFAGWLGRASGRTLDETRESDLLAYAVARHARSRATSANRRLTVFRRYFRWALRERRIDADPT